MKRLSQNGARLIPQRIIINILFKNGVTNGEESFTVEKAECIAQFISDY